MRITYEPIEEVDPRFVSAMMSRARIGDWIVLHAEPCRYTHTTNSPWVGKVVDKRVGYHNSLRGLELERWLPRWEGSSWELRKSLTQAYIDEAARGVLYGPYGNKAQANRFFEAYATYLARPSIRNRAELDKFRRMPHIAEKHRFTAVCLDEW